MIAEKASGTGRSIGLRGLRLNARQRRSLLINGYRVLLIAAFLVLWQVVSDRRLVDPFFLSSPVRVGRQLWEITTNGAVFVHTWVTLYEAVLGLLVGAAAGVATGVLICRWPTVDAVVEPFITVANAVPRLALTPLFIIWFGVGLTSKIVLVVSLVYFVLLVNTVAAVKSVDPDVVIVARLLGASQRRILWSVTLPSSVPWIFAGLRLGLANAFAAAVVGEMIAAQKGLGFLVSYSAGVLNITGVMVAVVAVMAVAYVADVALRAIETRLLRWRPTGLASDRG